jgi:hypothetical protein
MNCIDTSMAEDVVGVEQHKNHLSCKYPLTWISSAEQHIYIQAFYTRNLQLYADILKYLRLLYKAMGT